MVRRPQLSRRRSSQRNERPRLDARRDRPAPRHEVPTEIPPQREVDPYEFFRHSQLAELFNVSYTTVWRWERAGVLPPAVRFGYARGWSRQMIAEVYARKQREAMHEGER